MSRCWFLLLSSAAFSLFAEESVFDFSSFQSFSFPQVSKEMAMQESRIWNKGKTSIRSSLMRRDKNGLLHGHVHDSSLAWDWGVRNGIKYKDSHDEWVVAATYTHFHSKTYASVEKDREILPTWHELDSRKALELGQSSSSRWRLDVDVADLELGRSFSKGILNVRPHLGVRTTWMYQKVEINYERFAKGYLQEPIVWNNCLGLGSRGGLDTVWNLGNHIRLFGDGALSWLSGYTNIHHRSEVIAQSLGVTPAPKIGIAMLECSFGAQYEQKIPNSLKSLTMKVGYEFNYFLNKNQWGSSFSPITNNLVEKMSLQGLSVGFRLDF